MLLGRITVLRYLEYHYFSLITCNDSCHEVGEALPKNCVSNVVYDAQQAQREHHQTHSFIPMSM